MPTLLEYVGTVHIILGVYRGNPIALYLKRTETGCRIGPQVYPWNDVVGTGETPNKAAADFEEKWKAKGLAPDMYTGPHWEGGIKPEKPKPAAPPKPPSAPSAAKPSAPSGQHTATANAAAPGGSGDKPTATPKPTDENAPVNATQDSDKESS